jgi:hypothetical protein
MASSQPQNALGPQTAVSGSRGNLASGRRQNSLGSRLVPTACRIAFGQACVHIQLVKIVADDQGISRRCFELFDRCCRDGFSR